jgi:hypothetical protein
MSEKTRQPYEPAIDEEKEKLRKDRDELLKELGREKAKERAQIEIKEMGEEFSIILTSFDKQIEEMYNPETYNSMSHMRDTSDVRRELQFSSNKIHNLEKTFQEMSIEYPQIKKLQFYKLLKNNLSNLSRLCKSAETDTNYYGKIILMDIFEVGLITGFFYRIAPAFGQSPEYSIFFSLFVIVPFSAIFNTFFNSFILNSNSKKRYLSLSEQIYRHHDTFIRDAMNLGRSTNLHYSSCGHPIYNHKDAKYCPDCGQEYDSSIRSFLKHL